MNSMLPSSSWKYFFPVLTSTNAAKVTVYSQSIIISYFCRFGPPALASFARMGRARVLNACARACARAPPAALGRQYVDECPYLEKGVLLAVVPYEVLHAAYVDLGLGRLRGAEEGRSAAAAVASATSAHAAAGADAGEA